MNTPNDLHLHGPVGVVTAGNVHNHYSGTPCPGPIACPHRLPPEGSVDAKEENEFFRDTGIRAGPEGRRLLKEFQAQYSIRWRGNGGMRHMWQHRRLEYLDGAKQLRLNYSLTAEIYGWFIFLLGAAITVLVLIGVMLGRVTGEPWQILYLPLGMAMAWVAVDHMVLPESTARKLRKRMASAL